MYRRKPGSRTLQAGAHRGADCGLNCRVDCRVDDGVKRAAG